LHAVQRQERQEQARKLQERASHESMRLRGPPIDYLVKGTIRGVDAEGLQVELGGVYQGVRAVLRAGAGVGEVGDVVSAKVVAVERNFAKPEELLVRLVAVAEPAASASSNEEDQDDEQQPQRGRGRGEQPSARPRDA
jgi:ribosomal protein S1